MLHRVCVYCASSDETGAEYRTAAFRLGQILAEAGITIVYGGGRLGLMGQLAEGALARRGHIIGVIPRFMQELEWGHTGVTELHTVEDMRERKHRMLLGADAVIALPGGCGTLEELMEAITLKRLGLYFNPIVLVNVAGFFDPLLTQFARCIDECFMDVRHGQIWRVVPGPEQALEAIRSSVSWPANAREFAVVKPK